MAQNEEKDHGAHLFDDDTLNHYLDLESTNYITYCLMHYTLLIEHPSLPHWVMYQ